MNWEQALDALEKGTLRSANYIDGEWVANTEVKKQILEAFKAGELKTFDGGFVDKHNLGPQKFTPDRAVRLVPGGSSVRRGSYIAKGVIIMPPAYVNVGAYVDEGTMVDSNALVGSCAQIGKNVHLSAGVQIGGVLEPIGERPVVIEDDAFIGAGAIIVEGMIVGKGAVIAPGVILSKSLPVFDLSQNKILPKGSKIPDGAVVVPGTRSIEDKTPWAKEQGLSLQCPIIIKYRDEKSDESLELESLLR